MRALTPAYAAPPLGLRGLTGDGYPTGGFEPLPGDLLLLYTDGITEARNAEGRFYPLEERLPGLPAGSPADLLEDLLADVDGWVGDAGLTDDAALLALRWEH